MGTSDAADPDFEDLFRREYPRVLRSVQAIVGSRAVAEEVAQEAFYRALTRWPSVREADRPGAWVEVVALRHAVRQETRRRRHDALVATWDHGAAADLGLDLDLAAALQSLTSAQRHAVVLHHLVDLPVEEVAEILGVRPGTVKTHLHRGRARLAELLQEPEEREPEEVTP